MAKSGTIRLNSGIYYFCGQWTSVHVISYFHPYSRDFAFTFYLFGHPQGRMGWEETERERKEARLKQKRGLHELPFGESVYLHLIFSKCELIDLRNEINVFVLIK